MTLTLANFRDICDLAYDRKAIEADGLVCIIHPDAWRALRDIEARQDWYEHYRECRMLGKREIALETFWDGLP